MTFQEVNELRNDRLAAKMIKNLKARHFDAFYCKNTSELLNKIHELIPEGCSVSCGGSVSIRDTGILDMIRQGNYEFSDRDAASTPEEKRTIALKAMDCDYYLASVNAISEDGQIVNIDGNGNRVAACTWGPRHVVYVVGMNKVCQDLDAAIKRARSTAAPINATRFGLEAPCQIDGVCHDCKSPGCICNFISIQRMSAPAGRHIVVLVGEELGF
jgi:NADPH:quinone reductase-like Zn-dependent oxidoreductase